MYLVILLTLLFSLGEIMLCAYLIRRNQKPLSRIIHTLKQADESEPAGGSLGYVLTAVNGLSTQIDSMSGRIKDLTSTLRSTYNSRIVMGDITFTNKTDEVLGQSLFALPDKAVIRSIIMRVSPNDHQSWNKSHSYEAAIALVKTFTDWLRYINVDEQDNINLIYIESAEQDGSYADVLTDLASAIERDLNIRSVFFVGYKTIGIEHLYESFNAVRALIHAVPSDYERIIYDVDQFCSYNSVKLNFVDEEKKLINLIENGKTEYASQLLDSIYEKYTLRQSEPFDRLLLYYSLISVLLSCKNRQPLPPELRYSVSSMPPERFFKLVHAQCEKICRLNQELIQLEKSSNTAQIIEYIHQHYADPNISLTSVALTFGLTESTLSMLIKDNVGEPFSTHVENLRMKQAIKLLEETDISVGRIAEMVGYISTNTFSRAFRRKQGISPSEYRGDRVNTK
ncbi:MAG: helix-turn-helix transcriptional regulator [Clostridia bacterium]|nr:helix-turn-helix transcriptional regulator [Clostridia bacterium]